MPFDRRAIEAALQASWSMETARQWTAENLAIGQCNVTAILIRDLFGGEILKTPLPEDDHYYNRIDGLRFDFTASQFKDPIGYFDFPSNRLAAAQRATQQELAALRTGFKCNFGRSR